MDSFGIRCRFLAADAERRDAARQIVSPAISRRLVAGHGYKTESTKRSLWERKRIGLECLVGAKDPSVALRGIFPAGDLDVLAFARRDTRPGEQLLALNAATDPAGRRQADESFNSAASVAVRGRDGSRTDEDGRGRGVVVAELADLALARGVRRPRRRA